jgi:hypothetical protein
MRREKYLKFEDLINRKLEKNTFIFYSFIYKELKISLKI